MKILLVQTAFLGDVILSTPVIEGLKFLYPSAEIFTLTTPMAEKFLKYNPQIYKTLTYDKHKLSGILEFLRQVRILKQYDFDMVYSLQCSYRTSLLIFLSRIKKRIGLKKSKFSFLYTDTIEVDKTKHDALRNLSILSLDANIEKLSSELKLYLAPNDVLGEKFISDVEKINDYILLSPGSAWNTKRWSEDQYRYLVKRLLEDGEKIVITGSVNEKKICDKIAKDLDVVNLVGQLSIEQTVYVASKAKAIVCNDSMMLHISSAFKIPVVVVFCATSPKFGFGPWKNDKAIVIENKKLPCKPCRRHGSKRCPNGTNLCRNISYVEVYSALRKLL